MSPTPHPTTFAITGQLPFILIIAALLAFAVSLAVLRFYRRAVSRSMRRVAPAQGPPPLGSSEVANPKPPRDAQALFRQAIRGPWHAGIIYAIGGLAYAFVLAIAALTASDISFAPGRIFVQAWVYAWPTVLALCLVATANRTVKALLVLGYFLVLSASALLGLSLVQIATVWAVPNLFTTLLLLAFLTRRIRAIGPLVFTFLVVAISGSQMGVNLVALDLEHGRWLSGTAFSLGLGARGVFALSLAVGFAVFMLFGWAALRWIRHRYQRKKITDQSLTVDAIFIFFALVYSIFFAFDGPAWTLSGVAALLVYKAVLLAGFRLMKTRDDPNFSASRLLLLRVFLLGRRSERMFDALAFHWRYLGSVQLIAGPDLATTTVDPHEFLDFVAGKLARRFIDGAPTFDRRLNEMDLQRDFDGRYRVTDFFCQENTWKMVLSHLVRDADAVMMDLRGFSRANKGCVFEIQELVKRAEPGRVVFVTDETTDAQFLNETVRAISAAPIAPLQFFKTDRRTTNLRRLVETLCSAAGNDATTPAV